MANLGPVTKTHRTTVYLQVEPQFGRIGRAREDPPVYSIKVVGHTLKRPARPKSGTVVVGVTLEIPDQAFYPLRPEAVVRIPTDLTNPVPVEVEATDANEPEET